MMAKKKHKYAGELPPLSTEAKAALKADLEAHGQRDAILVDEDGNILDGRHRYDILGKNAKTKVLREVKGLSELRKRAWVQRNGTSQRNMSPDELAVVRVNKMKLAHEMRENDPKMTQKEIGLELGVARETVRNWFATNGQEAKGCKIDGRVKIPKEEREKIPERIKAGETEEQIAADLGVTHQAVSKIVVKAAEGDGDGETRVTRSRKYPVSDQFNKYLTDALKLASTIRHVHHGVANLFAHHDWNPKLTEPTITQLKAIKSDFVKLAKEIDEWRKSQETDT